MPPRYSKDSYEAQMTDYASTIEASWGGRASLDDAFLPGRSRIRRAPITWLPLRDIARLTAGESTNGLPPPRVCAMIEEAANIRERETAKATAAVADARRPRGGRGPTIMAADLVLVRDQLRKAQGFWQRRVNKKRPRSTTKDDVSAGGGGGESSNGQGPRGTSSVGTGGSANWDEDGGQDLDDPNDSRNARSTLTHSSHGYNTSSSRDYSSNPANAYSILPHSAAPHPQQSYGFEYAQPQYAESSRTGMQARGPDGGPIDGGPYNVMSRDGDHYQGRQWQPQDTFRTGPSASRPRSYQEEAGMDRPLDREYGSGSNGDTPGTSVSTASNPGMGVGGNDAMDKRNLPPPLTGLLGSGMVAANDTSRNPARVLADLPRQLEYQSHHNPLSHYPQQQAQGQPYQGGYSMPPPGAGGQYPSAWPQQQVFDTSRVPANLPRRAPPMSDDRYSDFPIARSSEGMEKHYSPQSHYAQPPQHPTLAGRDSRGPTAPRGVQLFSDSPGRLQQQQQQQMEQQQQQHRHPHNLQAQQQQQQQQLQHQEQHNRLGNWASQQQAQTAAIMTMKQGGQAIYPSGNGEELDREGRGWGP